MLDKIRKNWSYMIFILIISFIICSTDQEANSQFQSSQQQLNKVIQQQSSNKQQFQEQATIDVPTITSNQLAYTQNIEQFKSRKYNQRLQVVVGCWLLSKEYLDLYKKDYLFFKNIVLKERVTLKLVKQCMKKISRKDAVLKITELVGKNMLPPKKYEEVIDKLIIDQIFIQVNKQIIGNQDSIQDNQEPVVDTINPKTIELKEQENITNVNATQSNQTVINQQKSVENAELDKISSSMSSFDLYILELIKKYDSQFYKLKNSKEGLRGRVEQELKKREKLYFGFIPASSFTHSVFLVTLSLSMVFCCTCYKYYKMRRDQSKLKIKGQDEDQSSHSHSSHSHSHLGKKVNKMSQMTMKRKVK